jgi:hypothetical protein
MAFRSLLDKVLIPDLALALGTVGFGTIASFTALFFMTQAKHRVRPRRITSNYFGLADAVLIKPSVSVGGLVEPDDQVGGGTIH